VGDFDAIIFCVLYGYSEISCQNYLESLLAVLFVKPTTHTRLVNNDIWFIMTRHAKY
jgi:hypothetical protein